jgi:hypothetical protein
VSHHSPTISTIFIIKIGIFPNVIHRFSATPQNSNNAFHRHRENILKFTWKHRRPQKAKPILSSKKKATAITIFNFKFYCRAIVQKQYGIIIDR